MNKYLKVTTFTQKDDIENYDEIVTSLKLIGFSYYHTYNNIPFFVKYTVCKSIGDLINLYQIKCLLRQNKIPYQKKEVLEVSDEIKQIKDLKYYSYVTCNNELRNLKQLYLETNDPIYIEKQNEIVIKKAQADYLRANHVFVYSKQYYMLPEPALIYQNMILSLAKSGEEFAHNKNELLSTSSIIICIMYGIKIVSKGYGCVYCNNKYQLLNVSGRMLEWIDGKLRPNLEYRQVGLNRQLPKNHKWATPQDYLNYLDSYYNKLSRVTGQKYPKCKFIVNYFGDIQFSVPQLLLHFY